MDLQDALHKVGRGTVLIALGIGISTVLGYVLKIVLTRLLGPSTYGSFAQLLAIGGILAPISAFGLHLALPRIISFYKGKDRPEKVGNSLLTGFVIALVFSLLLAILLHLNADTIATQLFHEPQLTAPLQLYSFSIPLLALFYVTAAYIRGNKDAKNKVYLIDILPTVVQILVFLAFFWGGMRLTGAIYAYMLGLVAAIAAGFIYIKKSIVTTGELSFNMKEILLFSWPLLITAVVTAVRRWTDILMLGWFMDSIHVGFYEIAMSIGGFIAVTLGAIVYMVMPVVSELFSQDKMDEIKRIYSTATRWAISASLLLLAGVMIFPENIVQLLFGNSYLAGASVLPVLGIVYFISIASGPVGIILIVMEKQKLMMYALIAAASTNILLNILLIPQYGILGAGIALLVSYLVSEGLMLFFINRELGNLPYNRNFLRPFLSILAVSIPTYLLSLAISPGIVASIGIGLTMSLAYLYILYRTGGITEQDRKLLQTLWKNAADNTSF